MGTGAEAREKPHANFSKGRVCGQEEYQTRENGVSCWARKVSSERSTESNGGVSISR